MPEWIVSWHLFFLLLCFQQLPPPSTKRVAAPVIVHQSAVESRPHSPFSWQYPSLTAMEPIDTVEYMRTTPNSNSSLPKKYDQEFLCQVQKRGMQSCFFLFVLVLIELNSWGTSFLGL